MVIKWNRINVIRRLEQYFTLHIKHFLGEIVNGGLYTIFYPTILNVLEQPFIRVKNVATKTTTNYISVLVNYFKAKLESSHIIGLMQISPTREKFEKKSFTSSIKEREPSLHENLPTT